MHYDKVIGLAVKKKWPTAEEKEWWYSKLTATRRRKLHKLFAQQDGKCCYCKNDCFLSGNPPEGKFFNIRMATLEHLKTVSSGGTDNMKNLMMACTACNSMRGDMPHETFLAIRTDKKKWGDHLTGIQRKRKERKKEKAPEKEAKVQKRVLELAVLFILCPEIADRAQEIIDGYVKYREKYNERNKKRNARLNEMREDAGLDKLV